MGLGDGDGELRDAGSEAATAVQCWAVQRAHGLNSPQLAANTEVSMAHQALLGWAIQRARASSACHSSQDNFFAPPRPDSPELVSDIEYGRSVMQCVSRHGATPTTSRRSPVTSRTSERPLLRSSGRPRATPPFDLPSY